MSDESPVDYTSLSGANFQRAVGIDPEKWAEACCQAMAKGPDFDKQRYGDAAVWFRRFIGPWFADAIEAGCEAGRKQERKITGQFW